MNYSLVESHYRQNTGVSMYSKAQQTLTKDHNYFLPIQIDSISSILHPISTENGSKVLGTGSQNTFVRFYAFPINHDIDIGIDSFLKHS